MRKRVKSAVVAAVFRSPSVEQFRCQAERLPKPPPGTHRPKPGTPRLVNRLLRGVGGVAERDSHEFLQYPSPAP
jgi:hypothetical protein